MFILFRSSMNRGEFAMGAKEQFLAIENVWFAL
jgi:hypothetical protein